MASIPTPRAPRCLRHHKWMAGCDECAEQHTAEQEAARARRTSERRPLEAGGL